MTVGTVTSDEPVRERLVRASVRLFAERGYDRTSVQEIVEAAGVTKGALYHHFSSKDHLLYEIYHRLLTEQSRRLRGFVESDGPIAERLRAAAIDLVETSAEHVADFVVFFGSMSMLSGERAATVRSERRRYFDTFCGLVRVGQRSGAFRTDVSAGVVVHSFVGALSQVPSWYRPDGDLSYQEVGLQMVELMFDGLRRPAEDTN